MKLYRIYISTKWT